MDYVLLPIPFCLSILALMLPLVQKIWLPVVVAVYHNSDLWFGNLPGWSKICAFKMSVLEGYVHLSHSKILSLSLSAGAFHDERCRGKGAWMLRTGGEPGDSQVSGLAALCPGCGCWEILVQQALCFKVPVRLVGTGTVTIRPKCWLISRKTGGVRGIWWAACSPQVGL